MIVPNIDWLSATINIKDYEKYAKAIIVYLSEMKEAARTNSKDGFGGKTMVQLRRRIGTAEWIDFEILPNGSRSHAFILHNDSFEIKISMFRSRNQEIYPIQVHIKSEMLWSVGVFAAWVELKNIIESSFGKIDDAKISRLDMACHSEIIQYGYCEMERFQGRFEMDNIHRTNRIINALVFGSRSTKKIYVRIYDKSLELRKKRNKNWFYDIWNSNGYDSESELPVWNVEYELHREFFKEIGVNTVDEALMQLKSIWHYCTTDHLHLKTSDATRIERSSTDENWELIQGAYDDYQGTGLITRKRQISDNAEALIPAISGYITSFASKLGMVDYDEIIDEIKDRGLEYIEKRKETTVIDEVEKKAKLIYKAV